MVPEIFYENFPFITLQIKLRVNTGVIHLYQHFTNKSTLALKVLTFSVAVFHYIKHPT